MSHFSPNTRTGHALHRTKRRPSLPLPVNGVNIWTICRARQDRNYGLSEAEALADIMTQAPLLRPGRLFKRGEIARAIRKVYGTDVVPADTARRTPQVIAPEVRRRICPPVAIKEFRSSSPNSTTLTTAHILAQLYSPDETLAFKQVPHGQVWHGKARNLPQDEAFPQWITANPITGVVGSTDDGKPSLVAKCCFIVTKFVVVEFDDCTSDDEQLGRVAWIARSVPLALVLHSGNKSVHAWFRVKSEEAAEKLRNAAVMLGADPASLRRMQWSRTPNAMRDNGRQQSVLYFNPGAGA